MPKVQPLGERVFLVRLACGDGVRRPMPLEQFAALVQRQTGEWFDPGTLSRIENGRRELAVHEVETFARVDPLRRGPAWLAFGETPRAGNHHVPIQDVAPEVVVREPLAPAKSPAAQPKPRPRRRA